MPLILLMLVGAACKADQEPTAKIVRGKENRILSQKALLVADNGSSNRLQARWVDTRTLNDTNPGQVIDFGHHYTSAFSPDRRFLAAIGWPSDENSGGRLRLLDLKTGIEKTADIIINNYVNQLLFSPDGQSLFWTEPQKNDPSHDVPRDFAVYRYSLDRKKLAKSAILPSTFIPREIKLLDSGSRLAVYAVPYDAENLTEGRPRLFIINLESGRMVSNILLKDVTEGQIAQQSRQMGGPRSMILTPALAWNESQNFLYVVHADADRLTKVDLTSGKILKQAKWAKRLSFRQRLLNLLERSAEAKGMAETIERQAVISRDGKKLYITGQRIADESTQESGLRMVSLGLTVVDLERFLEMAHKPLPVSRISSTPNGNLLLLTGSRENEGRLETSGLYVFEAEGLKQVGHFPGELTPLGFSDDNSAAFLRSDADTQTTVLLLNLRSFRITDRRIIKGHVGDLLLPENE